MSSSSHAPFRPSYAATVTLLVLVASLPATYALLLFAPLLPAARALPMGDAALCEHTTDLAVCRSRACAPRFAWCELCGRCLPRAVAVVKDEL
jgi:hypothetical protein